MIGVDFDYTFMETMYRTVWVCPGATRLFLS